MMKYSFNEVVVYHDETKNVPGTNYKGHVLYFVPRKLLRIFNTPLFGVESTNTLPTSEIHRELIKVREKYSHKSKFHFSEIRGKKWTKFDTAQRIAMQLAVDSLKHKFAGNFSPPLNCKLAIIFYPSLQKQNLYKGSSKNEKHFRYDETLLRILLKGACHYLYDENNRVSIHSVVTDGQPGFRQFNESRIVERLTYQDVIGKSPLRDYVTIQPNATISHMLSDHTTYEDGTNEHLQAHMLQMADFLLGGAIRSCYTGMRTFSKIPQIGQECVKKDVIATPVREMLDKHNRGSGFKNSGHYKSFSISCVDFFQDGVNFTAIKPKKLLDDPDNLQMKFEDMELNMEELSS